MSNKKERHSHEWRMNQIAYIREKDVFHTGEAVILACLLHTKGRGRNSEDMTDVQRIMRDQNLELKKDE